MSYLNTRRLISLEGCTDTSIKYGIRAHRYDRVKSSFIETNFISSVFHLGHTLFYLAYSVWLGGSIVWFLGLSELYVFSGVAVILGVIMFGACMHRESDLARSVFAVPTSLYSLAVFPVVTAINILLFTKDAVFCSAYYLMDCFDTRPAHECLTEYLNENPKIKNIKLYLEQEESLNLKQLRRVVASIPSSVEKIEFCIPYGQSYSEKTHMSLFKALNSVNREKIFFNTQELTDKWETWQNAYTFRTLGQTSEPGRPRLNQDVIKYGIFSYLESSDINNMFDVLSPQNTGFLESGL
jgi:hypothetical protein